MSKLSREKGFTLIELMVALIISSVVTGIAYYMFISSYKGVHKKEQERTIHFEVETMWGTFERNISGSKGLLQVGESHLYYLDWNDKIHRLDVADSSLLIDGRSVFESRIDSVILSVAGESIEEESARNDLVELDVDGSGFIDQEELDVDGSGDIDQQELRYARLITISFTYGPYNRVYRSTWAIKNRISKKYDIESLELEYLQ